MRFLYLLTFLVFFSCKENNQLNIANNIPTTTPKNSTIQKPIINPEGLTVKTRFNTPSGYKKNKRRQ